MGSKMPLHTVSSFLIWNRKDPACYKTVICRACFYLVLTVKSSFTHQRLSSC